LFSDFIRDGKVSFSDENFNPSMELATKYRHCIFGHHYPLSDGICNFVPFGDGTGDG